MTELLADHLATMRALPWYREDAEGAPLCVVHGCNARAAWCWHDTATNEPRYTDEAFAEGALPLNMCVAHRWGQASRERVTAEKQRAAAARRVQDEKHPQAQELSAHRPSSEAASMA